MRLAAPVLLVLAAVLATGAAGGLSVASTSGGDGPAIDFSCWDSAYGVHFSPLVPDGHELRSQSWSFGDGQYSTARAPTHNYEEAGLYNVTLRVDLGGAGDLSVTKPVEVDSGSRLAGGRPPAPVQLTEEGLLLWIDDGTFLFPEMGLAVCGILMVSITHAQGVEARVLRARGIPDRGRDRRRATAMVGASMLFVVAYIEVVVKGVVEWP